MEKGSAVGKKQRNLCLLLVGPNESAVLFHHGKPFYLRLDFFR